MHLELPAQSLTENYTWGNMQYLPTAHEYEQKLNISTYAFLQSFCQFALGYCFSARELFLFAIEIL